MRRAFICFALITSLFVGGALICQPSPTLAAGEETAQLTQEIAELRAAGQNAKALEASRRLLSIAAEQEGAESLAVARALVLVAAIYTDMGNRSEAEPLLRRAVVIMQSAGADPAEVAAAQKQLAELERAQASAQPKAMRRARRGPAAPQDQPTVRDLRTEQPPTPAAEKKEWDVIPVFYGTDRGQAPAQGRVKYNDDRAGRLEVGRALVTVPAVHRVPDIERPWALRIPYFDVTIIEGAEDPRQHFTLKEVKDLPRDAFLSLVRERLLAASRFKGNALVFVHGFNTTFDYALFRTAQMAYDLHYDGVSFLYSWPSGGNVGSYTRDRESAEGAEPYLREFLELVIKETGAKSVSIIAHSMGNKALMNVLRDLEKPPSGVVISQIILAAPDVDTANFKNLAKRFAGLASGTTLYASDNDRALLASRQFWRGTRAGEISDRGPLVMDGIDTVDVSGASTDIFSLNHSGYAQNPDLLTDVGRLIEKGVRPPDRRFDKLKPAVSANGAFWRYMAGGDVSTGSPH